MGSKRIVVGIDGSEESAAALRKAADLAEAIHAELQIVCIVPRNPPPGPDSDAERRQLVEHRNAAEILAHAERSCRRPGLGVITETQTGPVAETLADIAESECADMVVVGHRGRDAVRPFLGSVADRLVQVCNAPVLVVR